MRIAIQPVKLPDRPSKQAACPNGLCAAARTYMFRLSVEFRHRGLLLHQRNRIIQRER